MPRRSRRKKTSAFDRSLLLLVIAIFFSGLVLGFFFGRRWETTSKQPAPKAKKKIIRQVPAPRPVKRTPLQFLHIPVSKPKLPRLAIVIDDVGQDKRLAELLWSFERPVTLAILPGLPYSSYFAEEGKRRGFEIILHQPFEPMHGRYADTFGMIRVDMSDEEVINVLRQNLGSMPAVVGINNHMGSLATQDPRVMGLAMRELQERGLFFLDSLTTPFSVVRGEAKRFNVPFFARDVFLDNESDPNYLHGQMAELKRLAKRNGTAIGIGHCKSSTLTVIQEEVDRLKKEGFDLVPLKELV